MLVPRTTQPEQILLIVAGAHRSGTSATAGALVQAGHDAGGESWAPDPNNPKGYFEAKQLVFVNEELMAEAVSQIVQVRSN